MDQNQTQNLERLINLLELQLKAQDQIMSKPQPPQDTGACRCCDPSCESLWSYQQAASRHNEAAANAAGLGLQGFTQHMQNLWALQAQALFPRKTE